MKPNPLPTLLNRSQLARELDIAPATLVLRIKSGAIRPDFKDGKGKELFDASKHKSAAQTLTK